MGLFSWNIKFLLKISFSFAIQDAMALYTHEGKKDQENKEMSIMVSLRRLSLPQKYWYLVIDNNSNKIQFLYAIIHQDSVLSCWTFLTNITPLINWEWIKWVHSGEKLQVFSNYPLFLWQKSHIPILVWEELLKGNNSPPPFFSVEHEIRTETDLYKVFYYQSRWQ